jgi:hypothetical protein
MTDEEEQIKVLDECLRFNRLAPPGTLCLYWPFRDEKNQLAGTPKLARSRGIAKPAGGRAVVFLESVRGHVDVSHIESEGQVNVYLAAARRALEVYRGESFGTQILRAMHDFDDELDSGNGYQSAQVGRYYGMLLARRGAGGIVPDVAEGACLTITTGDDPWGRTGRVYERPRGRMGS